MSQITFVDKVAINENPDVNAINKIRDEDINEIKQVVNNNTPTGTIVLFAGSTAPTGWLLCQGQTISRTTYANLFNVIGTTYGSGDGSTTFNLPNFKGNIPVGYDSTQTEFDTLGETGGEKTHTLTTQEIPSHNHEGLSSSTGTAIGTGQYGTANQFYIPSGGFATGSIKIGNTGGGEAHNNLQPYIVLNYMISY